MRTIYTVELYADLPDDDERHPDAMTGIVQDAARMMLMQAKMLAIYRKTKPPTLRLLAADAIHGAREIGLEDGPEWERMTPFDGPVRH